MRTKQEYGHEGSEWVYENNEKKETQTGKGCKEEKNLG